MSPLSLQVLPLLLPLLTPTVQFALLVSTAIPSAALLLFSVSSPLAANPVSIAILKRTLEKIIPTPRIASEVPRDGTHLGQICAKTGKEAACCVVPVVSLESRPVNRFKTMASVLTQP